MTAMTQNNLSYKGYTGSVLIRSKDFSLYGRILFIEEEILYNGHSFEELETNFRRAVEAHILQCLRRGLQPPFS